MQGTHGSSTLRVAVEDPGSPAARGLIQQLDAELLARYPEGSIHEFHASEIAGSRGVFAIARLDGTAVGCGALRPLEPGVGEIKRMFVVPDLRGRGIARAVLGFLEAAAAARNLGTLRLETGTRQPEAIRLYESAGYARIPCFGEYEADPVSVCFEKNLGTEPGRQDEGSAEPRR